MTYDEALHFIRCKTSLGIQPGLSRICAAMDSVCNVQNRLKIIHVAGTNGKGTVCYAVAEALRQQGYRVGLFTSPWIEDYREQIQINGVFIPKNIFAQYVSFFAPLALTEFELVTAVMYKYFYDSDVDYAVIECGMGGANDSTNVVQAPLVAAITSVSLDHTDFLGDTVEAIAKEKSGIIKKGCTAVLYPNLAAKNIFVQRCRQLGCAYIEARAGKDYLENDLQVAAAVLQALGVNGSVAPPQIPARCETVRSGILLDGAHNPDGAKALLTHLPEQTRITAVIAMMRDKDVQQYLQLLAPRCAKIIATEVPDNGRCMPARELAAVAERYCTDVQVQQDPHCAVQQGKTEEGVLLVCGSFYLAREIRKDL